MNKKEFLAREKKALSGLPQDELEERLAFYSEMIDDRIEEGLSEMDAILQIIATDETVSHLFSDESFEKGEKESKLETEKGTEIVLLVAGSPLWIPLLIIAFSVWISLFAVFWSVIVSLWAVFISLAVSAPVAVLSGLFVAVFGKPIAGIAMLGAGLVCAGLAVFLYYGAKAAAKGGWWLTQKSVVWVKTYFRKKEKRS